MKNLINRKVRGFKFESGYYSEMDNHIGEIGTIRSVYDNYANVDFKDDKWSYPLDQIEAHLIHEDSTQEAIELLESKGYKVTRYIPIGAMCLFTDYEERLKNNVGFVDMFQGMDKDKFRDNNSSWKYCKQVTITDV